MSPKPSITFQGPVNAVFTEKVVNSTIAPVLHQAPQTVVVAPEGVEALVTGLRLQAMAMAASTPGRQPFLHELEALQRELSDQAPVEQVRDRISLVRRWGEPMGLAADVATLATVLGAALGVGL